MTLLKQQKHNLTAIEFIKPMLAEIITKPFDDENWIFEIKYDGYRIVSVINNKHVELFSRNHLPYTQKYKPIAEELKKLGHNAVLDGEVVIEDGSWRSGFPTSSELPENWKGKYKILRFRYFKPRWKRYH